MSSVFNIFMHEMSKWRYWDDIDIVITENHEGDKYFIVDSWQDHDTLITHIREILQLDEVSESLADYEVTEALGVEIVFSDEYTTCTDCGCIIRTSPDSYHYQPDYYLGDGFIVCDVCFEVNGYVERYIEDKLNNPDTAINGLVNKSQIQDFGFIELDELFEVGYYGRVDNPHEIYEQLSEKYEDVLFFIDSGGQFSTNFKVFVRNEIECKENIS